MHEALIRAQLGDQIIGHIARDSTEIEAREKPAPKAPAVAPAEPSGLLNGATVDVAPAVAPAEPSGLLNGTTVDVAPAVAPPEPVPAPVTKRGRPRKGEERPKEPTVIERQVSQSVAESLADLPTACDLGSKKNSLWLQGDLDRLQVAHRHSRRRHPGDGDSDLGLGA